MKQTVFVFAAVLCVLLAGCVRTEVGETAPVPEETAAPVAESASPTPSQPVPAQPSEEPSDSQRLPGDEEKKVWETMPPSPYGEYFSDLTVAQSDCEEIAAEAGEDLTAKIPLFDEAGLIHATSPGWCKSLTDYPYLNQQRGAYTEAVRKMDDHHYYLMYDSDTGVRAYLFFRTEENIMDSPLFQYGYALYSTQELYYEDFAHIQVGDSMEKVKEIDPKVMELWTRSRSQLALVASMETRGYLYSYHILRDGIIMFAYTAEEGEAVIAEIQYSEDFMIENRLEGYHMGIVSYAIDPLDYVTKPQE